MDTSLNDGSAVLHCGGRLFYININSQEVTYA